LIERNELGMKGLKITGKEHSRELAVKAAAGDGYFYRKPVVIVIVSGCCTAVAEDVDLEALILLCRQT